jgi:hypothetical protein
MTFRGSSPPTGEALGSPKNGGEIGAPTRRAVEVDGGEIVLMLDADKILLWTPDLYDELTMTVGQARLLAAALLAAASDAETKS